MLPSSCCSHRLIAEETFNRTMEDDADLQAIRARRLAEMQAQLGTANAAGGGGPPPPSGAEAAEAAQRRSEMEERRKTMLRAILTAEARERLSRISLVKPEKARKVEDSLLSAAQRGQLGGQVTEEKLISFLEQIKEQEEKSHKVTVTRTRKSPLDDD